VSGLRAERSEASKSAQRRVGVKTRASPRNAPRFEKYGFDLLHCHLPTSLPAKPTFILQHFAAFQAQFLPQRLTSASTPHNHRKPSAAVRCHAKPPAPTLNRARFHPHLAHALTPAFAKTLCRKPNLPRCGRFAGKVFISRSTWNVPACLCFVRALRFNPHLHSPACAVLTRSFPLPKTPAPTRLPLLALNIAKRAASLFPANEP